MRAIIKYILETVGYIISWLFPKDLPLLWRANISHIYTGFLRRRFGSFGHDSIIAYKALTLQGLKYIHIGRNAQISKGVQLTVWTGYTLEKLKDIYGVTFLNIKLLSKIDYLIDGQFELENRDITLKWRGSTNQRVIDTRKSLEQNKVVIYCD